MDDPHTPVPAATLVIFRDRNGAAPDLLMVERAKAMAFAGGATVFPGGRVDPGDHALAARFGGEPEDIAARIAAIRETIEEAGVPIGLTPMPDADAVARLRAALHAGTTLGTALDAHGFTIDPAPLVPFARWVPTHPARRVFDTRFYLAALPGGAPEPTVDATENTHVFWAGAGRVLDEVAMGRRHVIFPTRRNLERLARYAGFAHARADALACPVRTVSPWTEERDGVPHLCIPDDLGYPVTAEPLADAKRG
ncbi:NUDIX domain-containing protein [Sphingomonas sp. H39-1-10]|uniref:NUDIX hydrolase n=1 Tax=Sphingomonas pollutisoli TaxID=3030829 RepID=UPI0023B93938|nr:NUDIX domain-containing protein [Sphingomonas pollutisoli]MDF0490892.1 NUDIX domain-containing protein [Sphingomonas pollutisoli]